MEIFKSRSLAKSYLVARVNALQGVKAVELCSREDVFAPLTNFDVPELLEELVSEKRILEIEYVLPYLNDRTKSFYLPIGTDIRLPNSEAN